MAEDNETWSKPEFSSRNEAPLIGNEEEFARINQLVRNYLDKMQGVIEISSYGYSPLWGYIFRCTYLFHNIPDFELDDFSNRVSRSTIMCWKAKGSEQLNLATNQPGKPVDLIRDL